jgi:hypothetical protein
MIKVSHEVPICMLEKSRSFNDYEYCLCHLYDDEKRPEYKNFYDESVKKKRHVILDNSIYELGKTFDPDKYAEIVALLNPTEYIVPDAFDNAEETLELRHEWHKKYELHLESKPISVVHGHDYNSLKKCMKQLLTFNGRIAFNFADKVYNKIGDIKNNKDMSIAMGRCKVISMLDEDMLLPYSKKYHLLGCTLPQEYVYANSFPYLKHFFSSIDTSSPVVHGIKGIKYEIKDNVWGLDKKEDIKLNDLIDHQVTPQQLKAIMFNIDKFKKILSLSTYQGSNTGII